MKQIRGLLAKILRLRIKKYLIEDEVVINWGILKKCILMLVLGCIVHLSWLSWDLFVLFHPEYWQYVQIKLIHLQLILDSSFLLVLLALIYSILIPAFLFLAVCTYLSFRHQIPYSPLFNIQGKFFDNGFWLGSMLYFMLPILAICTMLFEILLSQWRHRERLIQHLSQLDPLTSLFNRRSINQCLEKLNHSACLSYALVLLDLDHFKKINDQYGHHKGDETLIKVSAVLSQQLRASDIGGRFGGEEFILVLKDTNIEMAQQIAERCRLAIQQLEIQSDEGTKIPVTASFGIAISQAELRPQQLADRALYQAKARGRNQVRAYITSTQPELELYS
ncbi:GGDEF domain-containing protein [Acinetobacter sp. RF15A]|uniref:GGDEF domain-containing protein n=1 Tax=unclassified Acinetobacter TaxID=196816 RepID=UPI00118F3CF9|nr:MULTISPECIES: GGDEF domain-containing protein [unclassified Acinetobacter]TSH75841.1 GGDEF domain-containing protein [Acinetobacter sp. RF15A]TSI17480.1 GGDEF domain-containing protein [Acinetobacter sp. RF15B]